MKELNYTKPIRIQRKRIKGWKTPLNTIYVGRPTKWGNPYTVGKLSDDFKFPVTHEQAVGFYVLYLHNLELHNLEKYNELISELKGKNLSCFCPLNKPCHADILLELASK